METVNCNVCLSNKKKILFNKASKDGEIFTLNKCMSCGLEYISPRPTLAEIGKYYSAEYFTNRTERGYDNYFSEKIKNEIERVIALNLKDLDFYNYEKSLQEEKKALDIGCAAGYFVNYLHQRNWKSNGIDVSKECVDFACSHGLHVSQGDYLQKIYNHQFDLITMWATIEHLHQPEKFLEKIHSELKNSGMLYISTCRTGFSFRQIFGKKWRYYNFPEHLYFFSHSTMKRLLHNGGFKLISFKTYGSGFGKGGTIIRKIADFTAKHFKLGDMMLLSAKKY